MSTYYVRQWRDEFSQRQEDQSEYVYHPLAETEDYVVNYGVMDASEDMATIGEYMFSQEGWQQLDADIQHNQEH